VGLLALAAKSPDNQKHVPAWVTIIMPLLFASGMSLVDTADGILMLWSYGWATMHPERKLAFNLFLTTVSGCVALFVGLVETLGCVQDEFNLTGSVWTGVKYVNDHFEYLGYGIIGFFAASTMSAVLWFRCFLEPRLRERANVVDSSKGPESLDSSPDEETKAPILLFGSFEVPPMQYGATADRYSEMSSTKLVRYIRRNAPLEFLAERSADALLEGSARDWARRCSHRLLATICRELDTTKNQAFSSKT